MRPQSPVTVPFGIALVLATVCIYFGVGQYYDEVRSISENWFGDTRYVESTIIWIQVFIFLTALIYWGLHFTGTLQRGYKLDRQASIPVAREATGHAAVVRCYRRMLGSDACPADARAVEFRDRMTRSRLTPLQFAQWLLPLLGFVGTVLGVSRAIRNLELVNPGTDAMETGMPAVLDGLYVAFDTTLIGLLATIPITGLSMIAALRQAHQLDRFTFEAKSEGETSMPASSRPDEAVLGSAVPDGTDGAAKEPA